MRKFLIYILGLVLIAISSSCKRDELDFDKLSTRMALEQQLAAPLAYGELTVEKLFQEDSDTLLVIDGDTVKLVLEVDSIFHAVVRDLLDIPQQKTTDYLISPSADTPLPPVDSIESPVLVNDTLFTFQLKDEMKLDSIYMRQGNIVLNVQNSFQHYISLKIFSVSLVSPEGNFFNERVDSIPPSGSRNVTFSIDDYNVYTVKDTNNQTAISIRFSPVLYKDSNIDVIRASDELNITFGIDQIDDFDAIFGFFGYLTEAVDTVIEDFAPDVLTGLEGELNITNPSIRLSYVNSIGVAADVSVSLNLNRSNSPNTSIDLGTNSLQFSDDYLNPVVIDEFVYDRNNVPNIDELFAIPFAESVESNALAETNVGLDTSTRNWALYDSEVLVDADIEIPLELRADLTYTDTMQIRDEAPDDDSFFEIEYANLHYTFENSFPLGFGGELIVYDSINNVILDTIALNEDDKLLIAPAPVDGTGNVLESQIEEHKGVIRIEGNQAEVILNEGTHIIFKARIITTEYGSVNSVRIGADSQLGFQFGIETQGTYYTNNTNDE